MTANITLVGHIVADAELKFTQTGVALLALTVAENPHHKNRQTGEWEEGDPSFWNVTIWDKRAERFAESGALTKGTPVVVVGYPSLRKFERKDGTPGLSGEIRADTIATVPTDRASRGQQTASQGRSGTGRPWTDSVATQDDPWAQAVPVDEPPF